MALPQRYVGGRLALCAAVSVALPQRYVGGRLALCAAVSALLPQRVSSGGRLGEVTHTFPDR